MRRNGTSPPEPVESPNQTDNMYSADINFFITHQIAVATTNGGQSTTFFSRLDGVRFKEMHNVKALTHQEVLKECRAIHRGIWAKSKGMILKKIIDERTGTLAGFNLVTINREIQVGRSTTCPDIFYVKEYEGVALVHDSSLECDNWCQAYVVAKTYL